MENKAEFAKNELEKTSYVNTQEALVTELGKSLEFDVSLLTENPSKKFKHDDLGSWLGAVSLIKGKTPDIAVNISSDQGKNRVNFKVSDQEAIKSMDQAVTKEQLIYSVALTEAKLKCLAESSLSYIDGDTKKQEESSVLEIIEEVTPSIREQIKDYRKEMQEITEAILFDKRDKISLSDIISSAKFKAATTVTSVVVVVSLISAACASSPSPIITHKDGTSTVATPAITLTVEAPTEIPTIVPTLTATATEMPTATETPTEAPLAITTDLSGGLSEILKRIGRVSIEDIESGKYAEQERRMLESGEIPPFLEKVELFPDGSMEILKLGVVSKIVIARQKYHVASLDTDTIPYKLATVSMTEIDGVDILVFGVKNLNADGSVSFTHFGTQSFNNTFLATFIDKAITGEYQIIPVVDMSDKLLGDRDFESYFFEPTMYDYKEKTGFEIDIAKEWVKTEIVPKELEKELMMMSISRWY